MNDRAPVCLPGARLFPDDDPSMKASFEPADKCVTTPDLDRPASATDLTDEVIHCLASRLEVGIGLN